MGQEKCMAKVVCKNCLGTGIEFGVYGRRICDFCSGTIIAEVMAMSDDEVQAELVAAGVDLDAEVTRLREIANKLHFKKITNN